MSKSYTSCRDRVLHRDHYFETQADTVMNQICTEVLYQPLTLLDCLHTFCGSCLKEWFTWQVSQASHSNPDPYTCPSCRASVRETRPNATVTTLLDMYLQANPSSGKTEEEKQEMRQKYSPGEDVMPKIELKDEDSADEEDRRMLEEVRDMSLREVGVRGPGSYERGHRHRHRHRDGSRDTRDEDARQRRRERERHGQQEQPGISNTATSRPSRSTNRRQQARHLEHQSSLRSLLSDSGLDSTEMQVEILRQIQEEGLLDGVDLDNLDVSQEDELSERIADAYRRRHSQGLRSRISPSTESREPSTHTQRTERERPRHHQAVPSPPPQITHSSHPPISRPHLFEAYPTGHGHRHRTSSEHRREISPATAAALASTETQRQAARSATDLSDRPRSRTNVRDRPVETTRRTTEPERRRLADRRGRNPDISQTSRRIAPNEGLPVASPTATDASTQAVVSPSMPPSDTMRRLPKTSTSPSSNSNNQAPYPLGDLIPQGTTPTPLTSATQSDSHIEPLINCNRCGRPSIQYEMHMHCSLCLEGNFNVCLRCYRGRNGCDYWFGFGKAAMHRFEREEHTSSDPLPHRLTGRRYLRPQSQSQQTPAIPNASVLTSSDLSNRLQSGFFCSTCLAFTNECFWNCNRCNEGEWGYCNACVNQGKCCTHSLLPVAHPSLKLETKGPHRTSAGHSFTALSKQSRPTRIDELARAGIDNCTPLKFSTDCDICSQNIPPSTTRFHCPVCNEGDYDICTPCYNKLITSGRITPENGIAGWRKCPQGHRMLIIGFEDHSTGQRRVIVKDRIGGYSYKDLATTTTNASQSPGAIPRMSALRATALWAYWPKEGVNDELGFPRGAEIIEAKDNNGDWWEGWYCGKGGLWPAGYARVVR